MSELDTARHTGILPHGPKHQKLTVSLASCGPDRRWPRSNVNKRSTSILSSPTTSSDTHTTFLTTSHILTHSSEYWINSAVYSARSSEYPTVIGATNLSYMSGTHTSLSLSPTRLGSFLFLEAERTWSPYLLTKSGWDLFWKRRRTYLELGGNKRRCFL